MNTQNLTLKSKILPVLISILLTGCMLNPPSDKQNDEVEHKDSNALTQSISDSITGYNIFQRDTVSQLLKKDQQPSTTSTDTLPNRNATLNSYDALRYLPQDTLAAISARSERIDQIDANAKSDSILADTLNGLTEDKSTGMDTTVTYQADKIDFDVLKRKTYFSGRSKVIFKQSKLEADSILIEWDNDRLTAKGRSDTIWTDTTHTTIDSVKIIGAPVLTEDRQVVKGSKIIVNMDTKEGYLVDATTNYEEGIYHGEEIQKVSEKVFYVENGSFSSCNYDSAHFSFTGSKMKMVHGAKVVGKPIVLRFRTVPVFALPMGVFSIKPGKHSGIIIPVYGDDRRKGRNLRRLGYYYGGSDYWQSKLLMDFYEQSGMLFRGDVDYKLLNRFSGSISGSFDNQMFSDTSSKRSGDWDLLINHNQRIDPQSSLIVKAHLVSNGNYVKDYYDNVTAKVNQKLQSDATYTKRFDAGQNLTVNMSQTHYLVSNEKNQVIPRASFSLGTKQLFPSKQQKEKKQYKDVIYSPPEPRTENVIGDNEEQIEKWYNNVTYSYSTNFLNKRDVGIESNSVVVSDTTDSTITELSEKFTSGVQHSLSLNSPMKFLTHITFNPSLSYSEEWFNERRHYEYDPFDSSLVETQERGFFQRRTFNSSANLSTKLYGYFNINRGTVQVIRHVVTPSVGISYKPDFSVPVWGIYQELIDFDGNRRRFDRYKSSAFGGSSSGGKKLLLNMDLKNLFQMKRVIKAANPEDEDEEIKSDLFTYNLSSNYNLAADSLKWGNISSVFRATPLSKNNAIGPLQSLSIELNTKHSLYQYELYTDNRGREQGKVVNKFYFNEAGHGLNFARLTNLSAILGFSMSGRSPWQRLETKQNKIKGKAELNDDENENPFNFGMLNDNGLESDRFLDKDLSRPVSMQPWQIQGSFKYNLNLRNPYKPDEDLSVSGNLKLRLTKYWDFQYSSSVNLLTREVNGGSLSVIRDLHCWEGRLTWSPTGPAEGFYLVIGIKASQLQDVKIEQRNRGGGSIPYL